MRAAVKLKPNKHHTEPTARQLLLAFCVAVYLHEGNKQEESVGSPSDLLIQEPRQESKNPILGGTTGEENRERRDFVYIQQMVEEPDSALTKCINGVLMSF